MLIFISYLHIITDSPLIIFYVLVDFCQEKHACFPSSIKLFLYVLVDICQQTQPCLPPFNKLFLDVQVDFCQQKNYSCLLPFINLKIAILSDQRELMAINIILLLNML